MIVYLFAFVDFLIVLWLALAIAHWVPIFQDGVILPNGMALKREFDFTRYGRNDLIASDGSKTLAQDVEGVCFNDRYVRVFGDRGGRTL